MLCLSLHPGEYLTIGEDVMLQYDRTSGERCRLIVQAPKEIPIVRGEVRERNGGTRPENLLEKSRWCRREVPWDRSKAEALAAMERLLNRMDDDDRNVKALRRQLRHMFPEVQNEKTGRLDDLQKEESMKCKGAENGEGDSHAAFASS